MRIVIATLFAALLVSAPSLGADEDFGAGEDSGNPLIGRWQIDKQQSTDVAAVMLQGEEVEFLPSMVISDGTATNVTYQVLPKRVIVDYIEHGRKQVIQILAEDVLRMDLPLDEFLVYQKCTDRNRLLGRWTVDTHASHTAAIVPFEQIEILEFRDGEMRVRLRGGQEPPPVPVTYQVECDVVSVTNPAMSETQRYRMLSTDRAQGLIPEQPSWTLFFQRAP